MEVDHEARVEVDGENSSLVFKLLDAMLTTSRGDRRAVTETNQWDTKCDTSNETDCRRMWKDCILDDLDLRFGFKR